MCECVYARILREARALVWEGPVVKHTQAYIYHSLHCLPIGCPPLALRPLCMIAAYFLPPSLQIITTRQDAL